MKRINIFYGAIAAILLAAVLVLRFEQAAAAAPLSVGLGLVVVGFLSQLKSPLSDCKTMRFTNATGAILLKGAYVVVNNVFGFCLEEVAIAGEGVIVMDTGPQGAVFPKAAVTIAVGENAFYDASAKVVTNVGVPSRQNIGWFCEAAASGAATARVVVEQGRGLGPAT